jgi:hypothetical protein
MSEQSRVKCLSSRSPERDLSFLMPALDLSEHTRLQLVSVGSAASPPWFNIAAVFDKTLSLMFVATIYSIME